MTWEINKINLTCGIVALFGIAQFFKKVVVVFAACWFCFVFVIVSISTVQSIVSTRLIAEQQARQYLKVIQRNPRRRR